MAKISMVKGGKTVNGKFVPNAPAKETKKELAKNSTKTKTTTRPETVEETVARAKAMLGSAYNPNTPVPTAARIAEIANQDFIKPEIRDAVLKSLPKAQAPTKVTDITQQETPYTPPKVPAPTGDVTDATAGMSGYDALLKAQQLYQKQQLDIEKQRSKENKSLFEKFMGDTQSPQQAREEAWKDTGINVADHFAQQEAGIKEVESLTNDYNAVVAAKDSQIAATQDKMASMNFINNQVQQIERNAAPQLTRISSQINAKAAALQAMQGNFAEARAYVNQAVQDATAEAKFNFDMFASMYEMNQDSFERVDSIYSEAFKNQMQIAEAAYLEQKNEKTKIGELLLSYPTAGIRLTDTLDEAYEKAGLVAPTVSGDDLTADMRNYMFAKDQGYDGSFSDWVKGGGGSGSTSEVDALAMGLYLGDIGIGDVPSEKRDAVLNKYYAMRSEDEAQAVAETAPVSNQPEWFDRLKSGAGAMVNSVGNTTIKAGEAVTGFFSRLFGG